LKIKVKICGVRSISDIQVAVEAGAAYIGVVFFPKSSRNLSLDQGRLLMQGAPMGVCKVGLMVNPNNKFIESVLNKVPIDMIQLHGEESVNRVAEIKKNFGLPVMKAIGMRSEGDILKIDEYSEVADQILVDAASEPGSKNPGGNGKPFDWRVISDISWSKPWMLAGGLNQKNVIQAIRLTKAIQVDVSSGVEILKGIKSGPKITKFIKIVEGVSDVE